MVLTSALQQLVCSVTKVQRAARSRALVEPVEFQGWWSLLFTSADDVGISSQERRLDYSRME
jgi:hypothetical protein